MHIILSDGVDEVDADVGVEHSSRRAVGYSIPIDRANQKDTTVGDQVYLARQHGGRAGSKALTWIDMVEMGRSARQQ
jgi:hypothetical protein